MQRLNIFPNQNARLLSLYAGEHNRAFWLKKGDPWQGSKNNLATESYDRTWIQSSESLSQFVRTLLKLGFSVFPVASNAKTPALPWKEYQHRPPTESEIETWLNRPALPNLGIVTGDVSRLIVIDCDTPEQHRSILEQFPELTDTQSVKTRRGYHIYCRIPDGSAPPSMSASGLDLQSNGRYVVGPGSTVDDYLYTVSNPAPIIELTDEQISRLVYWIAERQERREQTPELSAAATQPGQWLAIDARNYYAALLYQGRNQALFLTAIAARDRGMTPDWTYTTLAQAHASAQTRSQRPENESRRLTEAQRTIASAYSRPPRPTGETIRDQVPTAARQEFNRRKQTYAWRFIQAARAAGIRPGDRFSYSKARKLLAGVIGDWTIRRAIDEFFTPLPSPRTANAVAIRLADSQKNHADFLGAQNQQKVKTKPAHRPPIEYKMPTNAGIMRALGLEHSTRRVIDPVPVEVLAGQSGAKNARIAMHRAFLQARPTNRGQEHRLSFLRARLGVCARTLKRYNLELGLVCTPQFEEIPLAWLNIDMLAAYSDPDSGLSLRQGHFLADETGKHYPPLLTIATKLIKAGHHVSLFKQRESRWNYGALRQPAAPPPPKPKTIDSQNRSYTPEIQNPPLPYPARHEEPLNHELVAPAPAQPTHNTSPRATAIYKPPPPLTGPARQRTYKRPLKSQFAEAQAQRLYSQIDDLSLISAREIIATTPRFFIDKALQTIQRREQKQPGSIRNRAGFLVTFIRSEKKAYEWKRQSAAAPPIRRRRPSYNPDQISLFEEDHD